MSTVLAEYAHPSTQFLEGKHVTCAPMGGVEVLDLPAPWGRCEFMYSPHSEQLTVPLAEGIAEKGIREFTWKLHLPHREHEAWVGLVKAGFGDFNTPVEVNGVSVRPLDLSIDETLTAIRDAVVRIGAKRAVIDSLSGLELALAPTFREDFRESLYRMIATLTGMGVTVMSTVELPDNYASLQFSPHGIAFLCDAIIMQRYVELGGELKRLMSVVKVRGSGHSKQLRAYEIDDQGTLVMGGALTGYEGLLTGAPSWQS